MEFGKSYQRIYFTIASLKYLIYFFLTIDRVLFYFQHCIYYSRGIRLRIQDFLFFWFFCYFFLLLFINKYTLKDLKYRIYCAKDVNFIFYSKQQRAKFEWSLDTLFLSVLLEKKQSPTLGIMYKQRCIEFALSMWKSYCIMID